MEDLKSTSAKTNADEYKFDYIHICNDHNIEKVNNFVYLDCIISRDRGTDMNIRKHNNK